MAPENTTIEGETMTQMNSTRSVKAPDASAPFTSKALAWVMLAAALLVAAVSFLIGMVPFIVEDDQPNPNVIDCGPALFHANPPPSPLCDAMPDFWTPVAQLGLLLAGCLFVAAIGFGIRAAAARRASGSLNLKGPLPPE